MKNKNFFLKVSVKVVSFMYQEQLNGYFTVKLLKDLYDIISYWIEWPSLMQGKNQINPARFLPQNRKSTNDFSIREITNILCKSIVKTSFPH